MKINRAAIKQNAKNIVTSAKPSPILVGLVYLAISFVLQLLFDSILRIDDSYMNDIMERMMENPDYIPALPNIGTPGILLVIAISVMSVMMIAGFSIYCMNICQFRKAGFGNLFDGFAIFFKVLGLYILMIIFIWLWSILLIIPGIIAAYRYRMALYIMIDNPQLSALECIKASKQMMNGRKGELFVLDLSFLGWYLLALFPLVTIWVTPYTSVTEVNFYLALRDMPKSNYNRVI